MMDQQRKNAVNVARIGEIQQRADDRSLLNQQRLLTEVQRTEAAKKRAALVGTQSQNQYNQSLNATTLHLGGINNLLMKIGGTYALVNFGKQIVQTRGEMELLEKSFEVLVGKNSQKMLDDLIAFDIKSPLGLEPITSAAQTLLGFGVEAERILSIIQQLGDVSMGNADRFKSLALAFAQTHAAGKLMGQDLLQYVNAGFNPLKIISEQTGKSMAVLRKEMADGAISAEMVANAFKVVTEEGGKFYEMTEKQGAGIKGLQEQLEGALTTVYNELGKNNESIIKGTYKMSVSLVENYETIGKILTTLIATYGAYKASLILLTATQKGYTVTQMASYNWLLLMEKAQKLLNATILKNPYILAAMALTGLVTSIVLFRNKTSEAGKASAEFNANLKVEREELDKLFSSLEKTKEGTTKRTEAINGINNKYGQYLSNLLTEKSTLEDIKIAQEQATQALVADRAAKMKEDYLSGYQEQNLKTTKRLYENIASVSKNLTSEQKGTFQALIEQGVKKSDDGFGLLRKSLVKSTGRDYNNIDDLYSGWDANNFDQAVKGYYRSNQQLSKAQQEAQVIVDSYMATISPKETKEEPVLSIFSIEVEKATTDIKRLQKELDGLRSGTIESTNYTEDISKVEDALKKVTQDYQTLTGKAFNAQMKVLEGSVKHMSDKLSEAKKNLDESTTDEDRLRYKNEIEFYGNELEALQNRISLLGKDVILEAIQGIIRGVDVAVGKIEQLTEQEKIFGKLDTSDLKKKAETVNKPDVGRSVTEWKDLNDALSQTGKELEEIGDSIGGSAGELLKFAGGVSTETSSMINDITRLSELSSKSIEEGASLAEKAVKGVEKASVILAIISAALKVVNMISNALDGLKDAEREREEALKSLIDLQQSYNNELIRSKLLQNDVFGTNDIGNMISATNALSEATENYNNILDLQQKKWKDPDSKFYDKLYQYGTIMGWAGDRTVNDKTGTTALRNNLRYITKKSSNGVLGIGGNHTKTMDLEEWVKKNLGKELFFKDGRLNLELALQLVDSSADRLAGETEESLRKLIEAEEIIREAEEAMAEYISNTFGQLGDGMSDSIIRAFRNGENAAKSFKDSVNSVLEEIGAQIVRNLYIQNQLDALEKNLKPIYENYAKSGDKEVFTESLMSQLESFWKGMGASVDQANNFLDMYQQSAQKHGFDIYKPDSNKGTLGASIQSLTENTGSLVASYMNAMRADLAQQKSFVERIALKMEQSSMWFAQVYAKLVEIEINTKLTANNTTELVTISKETRTILKSATTPGGNTKFNMR